MNRTPIDNAISGPPTGGSHEPTFAGVPSFMRRRLSKDIGAADIVVWGVPFDCATSNRPGARFGPILAPAWQRPSPYWIRGGRFIRGCFGSEPHVAHGNPIFHLYFLCNAGIRIMHHIFGD